MGLARPSAVNKILLLLLTASITLTSNGSWCMGIKGEMSGTVYVTFTWDMCIDIWVVYSLCFFCCLFITVTWWHVWCFEWASGNQEEVQACLVTLWLFIISFYSLYKTTLGLLCSWFENNPHFHKYSMDFYPRPVLAFGYCHRLRLCVCVSVCVSITCLSTR